MPTYTTADIRNVLLVGHGGCGKTSLADALLFAAGTATRKGSPTDGSGCTLSSSSLEDEASECGPKNQRLDIAASNPQQQNVNVQPSTRAGKRL